jgi:hypothetical protein
VSRNTRFVDVLCALQARAILADPTLVDAARAQLPRLEGSSAWHDTWAALLDAGPVACGAVLTSTSAAAGLKADSPFAYVVEITDELRQELVKESGAHLGEQDPSLPAFDREVTSDEFGKALGGRRATSSDDERERISDEYRRLGADRTAWKQHLDQAELDIAEEKRAVGLPYATLDDAGEVVVVEPDGGA